MKTLNKKITLLIALSIALTVYSIIGFEGVVSAQPFSVAVATKVISGLNQATFTATENGTAKENVNIYLDGVLGGQTDSNGQYVASGLTAGFHTWEAEYGGGIVDLGKFIFLGYGIKATGTSWPSLGFNYTITAIGTQYSYEDQQREAAVYVFEGAKGEDRTWFHIDYTQTVRIKHYYEPPSLGGYVRWSDGGERCVNPSSGEYQTLTPGDWYIYAGAGTLFKKLYCKVLIWFKSRTDAPWSATESGSSSVSYPENPKYIKTSSLSAPNEDTSWSVVDDKPFCVHSYMNGNQLFANANDVCLEDWSQAESGTGSVTDEDVNKLIAVSTLLPPDEPKFFLEYIIVDGLTVYDNDSNDLDGQSNIIEYEGIIAWMYNKELHASMSSYHPPAAFIDSISPKITQVGEAIAFSGHGEDQDAGDFITSYKWRSHKDGDLSDANSFTTTSLSAGRHVVYFRVADSTPYTQPYTPLWSPEATDSIRVNKPPFAFIHSIEGTGVDANDHPTLVLGDSMTFQGVGIDTDGYITEYEWRSNISGLLSTSESFSTSNLPIGHHTIVLKVRDNDGAYSKEVSKEITVRRTPVVYVGGWQCDPEISPLGIICKDEDLLDFSRHYELLDPEGTKDSNNLRFEHGHKSIIFYANRLYDEIEELKRNTGAKKVDIVAHSMGGLISRWYIEKGYWNDVRKFVSIGSPHHGSDWAYLADFSGLGFRLGGKSAFEMTPHSPFLNRLNGHNGCATTRHRGEDHINSNVEYSVIAAIGASTLEHSHLEIEWLGIDIILPGVSMRGDTVVATESSILDKTEFFGVMSTPLFITAHMDLAKPDIRPDVWSIVKAVLRDTSMASMDSVQGSATNFQGFSENMEDILSSENDILTAFQLLQSISDTVYPGKINSHTIHIDSTVKKAIFELGGLCELDLVLVSPSGVTIDPSDPDISYTREVGYVLYEIPNPESGEWTLEPTAIYTAESECIYTLRTFTETDLFVGVGTDKNEYKPNDPISIYGYVQDNGAPFEGSTVIAEIKKPDGSSETISLFDDGAHNDGGAGDGIYANTYFDSFESGIYNITVTATIPEDSESYNRSARTAIWVELLPDLAISDSDISFSNTNPEHGDTVTISAIIHNTGDADANDVKILFFDGDPGESGVPIGEKRIDCAAGNTTNVSVPWDAVYGNHTIHVIISPFNNFLEQRYDNNRASTSITVEDTEMPIADAGPDQVALVDTPVFFDGSRSTDNAGIVIYKWDVDTSVDSDGDGISDNDVDLTGAKQVFAEGYHSTGTYIVKLSVNDAAGNGPVSDILVINVTSEYDREPPNAVAGSDQIARLRAPILFDASQSSDNFYIASYQWDIDTSEDSDQDGIPDNDIDLIGVRPLFASGYSTPGEHIVKLTVDDVAGNGPAEDTLTVTVNNSAPIAVVNGPYLADEGSLVILNGGDSSDPDGDLLQYRWDFDNDGIWDTEWSAISTAHYVWGDDYSGAVSLEVTDGDLSDIATAEVTINNVAPEVELGSDKTVEEGNIVSFYGLIIDPGELDTHTSEWDFGDGSTATGTSETTHEYDNAGVYTVTLTVVDDDGGTGYDTLIVTVTQPDIDRDGIPDYLDACPDSDLSPTIVIDDCDTYVENYLLDDGCTISDRITKCAEGTNNHGKFVRCVSNLTIDLKKEGFIKGNEKGAIQRCAAGAEIP